ncbi:MAG: O-methyltransferase, partial [Cyclobacteriaceae bacterium]
SENYPRKIWKPTYLNIFDTIEARVKSTAEKGNLPLWQGYQQLENYKNSNETSRNVYQVRSSATICKFYTDLVRNRRPETVLEIGTAFGISGMYWLAGLDQNSTGKLLTFEPNEIWAEIAEENLKQISSRFYLFNQTFEEGITQITSFKNKIDIAFIDAIHTSEFVLKQFELIQELAKEGALIIFDDINFSEDMKICWNAIAKSENSTASLEISNRVGIIEFKKNEV